MTTTPDPSPQDRTVQAILAAAYALPLRNGQPNIGAGIRAMVEATLPEEDLNLVGDSILLVFAYQRQQDRRKMLAIATELEATYVAPCHDLDPEANH